MWIFDLQKTFSSSVEFNKTKELLGAYEHEDRYLRCKGQLGRGKLSFDTKLPILLPNFHHFTDLVVLTTHEKVYHNDVRQTLLEIRSKYWIPKGRQTVKRILNKCALCRKLEGLPCPSHAVSDLPEFRVVGGPAFKAAGVGLCGSVYTKVHPKSTEVTKNYITITIFTDFTRWFYSIIFTKWKKIYCMTRNSKVDCFWQWKTFKGRALKQLNAKQGTKRRYNLSGAPWCGGWFECLIRSVKRCLIKSVMKMKLKYEELTTAQWH